MKAENVSAALRKPYILLKLAASPPDSFHALGTLKNRAGSGSIFSRLMAVVAPVALMAGLLVRCGRSAMAASRLSEIFPLISSGFSNRFSQSHFPRSTLGVGALVHRPGSDGPMRRVVA